MKFKKNKFFDKFGRNYLSSASLLTFLVISIFLILGPASAINLSIGSNNVKKSENTLINFNVEIKIDSNERIPVKNLTLNIKDKDNNIISSCTFTPLGIKTNKCDEAFGNISLNPTGLMLGYGYLRGYGYEYGYGYQTSKNDIFYGYGYGYEQGYGYESSVMNDKLIYNVQWRTPFVNEDTTLYADISAIAENAGTEFTYIGDKTFTFYVKNSNPILYHSSSSSSGLDFVLTPIEVEKKIVPNNKLKFTYKYKLHRLIYNSIKNGKVNITIMSIPTTYVLRVGDIIRKDLDGDGIYDMEVKLISLDNQKAKFTFVEINSSDYGKEQAPKNITKVTSKNITKVPYKKIVSKNITKTPDKDVVAPKNLTKVPGKEQLGLGGNIVSNTPTIFGAIFGILLLLGLFIYFKKK